MALSQYKALFLQHTRERVARFEDLVIALEKDMHDTAIVTEIMATLHAVKSDAATMNYSILASVMQELEGFLQPYRDGTRRVNQGHITQLFELIDALRADLDSIAQRDVEIELHAPWGGTASVAKVPASPATAEVTMTSMQSTVSSEELVRLMRTTNDLVRMNQRNIRLLQRGDTGGLMIGQHTLAMDLSSLREQVVTMTMVSVRDYFSFLGRFVRDVASREKKKVLFSMDDGGLKLELKVLDTLRDVCIQILKNAIAHGVTRGARVTVRMTCAIKDNVVTVAISDTGRGIDMRELERIGVRDKVFTAGRLKQLTPHERPLFLVTSGVSTREHATDISGRGVGMLGVKRLIKELGGSLSVVTHRGVKHGTTFTVSLPLQPSMFRALTWRWGHYVLGLPLYVIEKVIHLPHTARSTAKNLVVEGTSYRAVNFAVALGLVGADRFVPGAAVLLVNPKERCALMIPSRFEEQELITEHVPVLVHHPLIMGVSVSEHGTPITILNLRTFIDDHAKG